MEMMSLLRLVSEQGASGRNHCEGRKKCLPFFSKLAAVAHYLMSGYRQLSFLFKFLFKFYLVNMQCMDISNLMMVSFF